MQNEQVRHVVVVFAMLALVVLLGKAILDIPAEGHGLALIAADALPNSGVINPVTAVLLNFRAFDTLLEISVLLLTLVAVWALGLRLPDTESLPASPLVNTLLRINLPLLTMIAGYLLWIGASEPGGAFQAGAVLTGIGVLMRLNGLLKLSQSLLRWMAIAGLLVFVLVALAMLGLTGGFLQYPISSAGTWILVIETAATVSIGVILTALFIGQETDPKQAQP
jgi:multisubunit Na+/H+ antiporter MnhB subunit